MHPENVLRLNYVWRFDSFKVAFLNKASAAYAKMQLKSISHEPAKFSVQHVQGMPETLMRIVMYESATIYQSWRRGQLRSQAHKACAGSSVQQDTETDDSERVGVCLEISVSVAHDALCVIALYIREELLLSSMTSALKFEAGGLFVATIMYLHDLIVPFAEFESGLLDHVEVLQCFRSAALQHSKVAASQGCSTLQHCNTATLQHCNVATLQHCNTATLTMDFCSVAMLPNLGALQP